MSSVLLQNGGCREHPKLSQTLVYAKTQKSQELNFLDLPYSFGLKRLFPVITEGFSIENSSNIVGAISANVPSLSV